MNAVDRRKFLAPAGIALRIVPPTRNGKKGILTVFAFTIPIKNSSVYNRIKRYTSETADVLRSTTSFP
jgi:hypothetical protein